MQTKDSRSLWLYASALALLALACLRVGNWWESLTHERHPSLALIPLHALLFVAGVFLWDRLGAVLFGLPRLHRRPWPLTHLLIGVSVAAASLYLAGTALGLGKPTSFGRMVVVLSFSVLVVPIAIACAQVTSEIRLRPLLKKRGVAPVLAAIVSILLCVGFLAAMETTFGFLNSRKPPGPQKVYEGDYLTPGRFYRPDADLGTALRSDTTVQCRLRIDQREVWSAQYSTDAFGRRTTTQPQGTRPEKCAVFFGCSFLFGEGSNDDQTIPSQFSAVAPEYRSYNYGVPGYGTQQMLAILESDRQQQQVTERSGLGIYLYLEDVHEARVVGDMDIVNSFGGDFPYYVQLPDGAIKRRGTFATGRPVTQWLYSVLGQSQTRAWLALNFPRRSAAHHALTAALVKQSRDLFLKQFPGSRFVVAVYPKTELHRKSLQLMQDAGIEILDLSSLFDPNAPELHFGGDGHPNPLANRMLAEALAVGLKQQ
ncbi:MAG: hypothetical protein WCK86_15160 [Planctomycetia bacterium]